MIAVPYSTEYERNAKRGASERPCLLCAKEIKTGKEGGYAIYGNNDTLLTQAEADEHPELNQGAFPVGRECWKLVPKEYRE